MKSNLLLFFFMFSLTGYSQSSKIFINCQLLNESTNNPIAYASIHIQDTYKGTISDSLGFFDLMINNNSQNIIIQSIGFEKDTVSAKILFEEKIHFLKVANYELSEAVVFPKNAFEIMRKAIAKIPENYDSKTIAQNIFYRQEIIANDMLLSIEEANFDALVKFKNKNVNIVSIKKSRAIIDLEPLKSMGKAVEKQLEGFDSTNIRENATQFFGMNFMLDDELGTNSKGIFGKKGFVNYKYNYNGLVKKDGYYAYHITFDQRDDIKKSLFNGHFYIDTTSLAFFDIQIKLSPKGIEYQKILSPSLIFIAKILGYTVYVKGMSYELDYNKIDDKWVLIHAETILKGRVAKKGGGDFSGYYKTTFYVNDFYLKEGFYNKRNKYDKIVSNPKDFKDNDFWGKLKYIPLSKYEKRLISKK